MYFSFVTSVASVPTIKSASFVKFPKPFIAFVKFIPEVFTYIPTLEADTDIGFLALVLITTGVCGTPFTVIVAVEAPTGALITTPPNSLPVSGVVNGITVLYISVSPFTVILP